MCQPLELQTRLLLENGLNSILIEKISLIGKKPEEPAQRFNLKTFTVREAVTFFLNYKNAATMGNEHNLFQEAYNVGKARIGIPPFWWLSRHFGAAGFRHE